MRAGPADAGVAPVTTDSRFPAPDSRTFSFPTRVYWEDTDAGGVVYHARYVAFLERARSEWLRALGHGQDALRDRYGLVFAVRSMRLDFLAPARLDDLLAVDVGLLACRGASAVFAQAIRRDGDRLLAAEVKVAALDAATFRPRAIPDPIHELLSPFATQTSPAGLRDPRARLPRTNPGADA